MNVMLSFFENNEFIIWSCMQSVKFRVQLKLTFSQIYETDLQKTF